MGSRCLVPVETPYEEDTPDYARLNWKLLAQNGYYGVFGYGGGNTLLFSTAIIAGQKAVDSLNPKTYANKSAFIFQLANDSEIEKYFGLELKARYRRNFIIVANYPFKYCHTKNYSETGITSVIRDIAPTEYKGNYYFMDFLDTMYITGNPEYGDCGVFEGLPNAYYSLAEFFRTNTWVRPVKVVGTFAHDEHLGANCAIAYGHKIGFYGEPNYYAYEDKYFASETPATMKIIPSEGYSIAKPGHLKVFNDGVEIPYTQDLENGLINFMTP